ncbi:MAG: GNAT family N-acetyltransferase [Acidobacteriota bacterium]
MSDTSPLVVTIRQATPDDAERIVRAYLDSAEQHARLDPERYAVPDVQTVVARYREGRQHAHDTSAEGVTFVAELGREIVGFVDARLDRSPDAMHREMTYCHIVEIAVTAARQGHGVGAQLLRAAEDWGRAHGATFASLEYLAANARASDFYQRRMGYHAAAITAIKKL